MELVWRPTVEVIAVEAGDAAGWVEAATALGEVEFTSLQTFMDNVTAFIRGTRMHRLHLQAHGDSTGIEFGADFLTLETLKWAYRGQLARLTPLFTPGAVVVLRACEVGQSLALLQNLAALWNVEIVAGRGLQNNLFNANTGRYVIVRPDGSTDTSIFLPPEANYEKDGADKRLWQKYLPARF